MYFKSHIAEENDFNSVLQKVCFDIKLNYELAYCSGQTLGLVLKTPNSQAK